MGDQSGIRIHERMNRLLLFVLLGIVLIDIAGGDETDNGKQQNVQETEMNVFLMEKKETPLKKKVKREADTEKNNNKLQGKTSRKIQKQPNVANDNDKRKRS